MQPTFLPWQGYFELINKVDCFIFLDDFQFSVQSYHQRNKLFVNKDQVGWVTVPVQKSKSFGAPLNSTRFDESRNWRRKLLSGIQQNYSKTSFYNAIFPPISAIITNEHNSLADLNIGLIKAIVKMFDWTVDWKLSSDLPSSLARSERVLELLRWSGASQYYAAGGSADYMKADRIFPVSDIEVMFQKFHITDYPQRGSTLGFVPSLSVLDALFNLGPMKTAQLIINEQNEWNTWN